MADFADDATEREEVFFAEALDKIKNNQGEASEFCECCGAEIPEKRRQAMPGCKLCICCQEKKEKKRV
ncbi:MAG: TraR/DksA C4-type zinc finger protein [Alphaproteobacteria bacterium]